MGYGNENARVGNDTFQWFDRKTGCVVKTNVVFDRECG